MKISKAEQEAIVTVIELGKRHGFGNLIGHLSTAWARMLVGTYGMTEAEARRGAFGLTGYPFAMQDDLIQNGEWDESGEKYS